MYSIAWCIIFFLSVSPNSLETIFWEIYSVVTEKIADHTTGDIADDFYYRFKVWLIHVIVFYWFL